MTISRIYRNHIRPSLRTLIRGVVLPQTSFPPISAEELSELKAIFPTDKFFIFGHGRSGTTLLARLIRLHQSVHCNWQAHFFTRPPLVTSLVSDPEVARWLSRRNNRWNRGKDLSPVVLRGVCDTIMEREARRVGKRIIGDKSPNTLYDGEAVRMLSTIYPDAKLIVIIRDGRDTVLSHIIQEFVDHPERLDRKQRKIREALIKEPDKFYRRECSLFTEADLKKRADGWAKNVTETAEVGRALLGDHFTQIRYEDLLLDTMEVLLELWDFLDADPPTGEILDRINEEVNTNLDAPRQVEILPPLAGLKRKGGPGLWQELFTNRDREIFKASAGEALVELGYETGSEW